MSDGPSRHRGSAVEPFSGTGQGGQEYLTYRVRAFLDQIAGLDRLPAEASFADGLRNLRIQ